MNEGDQGPPRILTYKETNKKQDMKKFYQNSVEDLVYTLIKNPLLTENKLIQKTFGFKRGRDLGSNKKYADLVRRALNKGLINRIELKIYNKRAIYYYYLKRD